MRPAKDYTGHRFERLVALRRIGRAPNGVAIWSCRCDCGNQKEVSQSNLVSGHVRSCGCLAIDVSTKHAMTESAEYRAWQHMKERCSNRRVHNYHRYGGRGIKVCDRWLESFENFLSRYGAAAIIGIFAGPVPEPRRQLRTPQLSLGDGQAGDAQPAHQ